MNRFAFVLQLRHPWPGSIRQTTRVLIMNKKYVATAMAIFAFGFFAAPNSNAGTEVIQDYGGSGPTYNYAPPPPRPVYYAPPPVIVYPTYAYYARPFGYYGAHRVFVRHHRWYHH